MPTDPSRPQDNASDRRHFLTTVSSLAVGTSLLSEVASAEETKPEKEQPGQPVLQNPSPSSMSVAWSTPVLATGWVEYGTTPELGKRVRVSGNGLNQLGSRFLSARMQDLPSGQKVYYRTVTTPIDFKNAYQIKPGEPIVGDTYAFQTPDASAPTATFAMINDTHEKSEVVQAIMKQLADDPADFTVWNGDVFNDVRSDAQIVDQVLEPAGGGFAVERPVLFTSGNHDVRGVHARALSQAMLDWPNQEHLGRSFAVRQGPLAIVGLDTGEDKPDAHPVFAGLANFEPYREAQGKWLAETLKREEIASAPYIVVFCHIPLWGRPGDNPGDTLDGFASYSRQSQRVWHPHLAEAGVQLVASGHTHRFRYDAPTEEHSYAQFVGGGPSLSRGTILRASADSKQLKLTATTIDGKSLDSWTFAPRKV
ncbi:metallophosphoesterase family protein [Blastopirellula marina]|uniref:Calcineurin-like phosphoesterase domain-containing protein n=1 Tax=Blastopirellula marina TaxID=124 RepID=A0A2S8G1E8_9BACT|nr:metallophosphoesterase [Blastopirellula marina]PQO38091.1 hypothetical protein C5Y98_08385 [Blastopirellula marina]PTL44747.1 hypothetical protein C5Y97_08385 [Blastopirellula marina]